MVSCRLFSVLAFFLLVFRFLQAANYGEIIDFSNFTTKRNNYHDFDVEFGLEEPNEELMISEIDEGRTKAKRSVVMQKLNDVLHESEDYYEEIVFNPSPAKRLTASSIVEMALSGRVVDHRLISMLTVDQRLDAAESVLRSNQNVESEKVRSLLHRLIPLFSAFELNMFVIKAWTLNYSHTFHYALKLISNPSRFIFDLICDGDHDGLLLDIYKPTINGANYAARLEALVPHAIKYNRLRIIKCMIEVFSVRLDYKYNRQGDALLHLIDANVSHEIVSLLLSNHTKISILAFNKSQETVLLRMIKNRVPWKCFQNIFQAPELGSKSNLNVFINKMDVYGNTPLTEALKQRNYEVMSELLAKGADPRVTVLVNLGNPIAAIIEGFLFLASNERKIITRPCLNWAVNEGDLTAVKILVLYPQSAKAVNSQGENALKEADRLSDPEMLRILRESNIF